MDDFEKGVVVFHAVPEHVMRAIQESGEVEVEASVFADGEEVVAVTGHARGIESSYRPEYDVSNPFVRLSYSADTFEFAEEGHEVRKALVVDPRDDTRLCWVKWCYTCEALASQCEGGAWG